MFDEGMWRCSQKVRHGSAKAGLRLQNSPSPPLKNIFKYVIITLTIVNVFIYKKIVSLIQ